MISFGLEDDQQIVKDTAHKFAAEVIRPGARAWERAGGVPDEVQRSFFELGLGVLDLKEAGHGLGQGLGMVTAAIAHEELAWGDAGAAVALWAPHFVGHAVEELGTREQQERLLHPFAATDGGLRRGAVAYSESWKTQVQGFSTTAVAKRDCYELSGVKSFVVNAGLSDLTVVFAQLDPAAGWDGFATFAVAGRAAAEGSFRTGERHRLLGLETVTSGELVFDGLVVREQDRLRGGDDLRRATQRFFARARLCTAARQVGLARAAYEYALEYTQERRAFGKPVAHFQAISFTLAEMLMDVEAARWMVWRAASAADQGQPDVKLFKLCAQAAVHANEAAWRVADNCLQLLGGAGYIQDFPAEKWLRDTKALALLGGTDQLSQQLIAEHELGHPLDLPGSVEGSRSLPSCAIQPVFT